jgi:hypothetical protein
MCAQFGTFARMLLDTPSCCVCCISVLSVCGNYSFKNFAASVIDIFFNETFNNRNELGWRQPYKAQQKYDALTHRQLLLHKCEVGSTPQGYCAPSNPKKFVILYCVKCLSLSHHVYCAEFGRDRYAALNLNSTTTHAYTGTQASFVRYIF